jgi:hypothetical protein
MNGITELIIYGACIIGVLVAVACVLGAALCKAAGDADERLGYK